MARNIQKPRGTQDILPIEQRYWFWIEDNWRKMMLSAGFGRITTPTFEDTNLFTRGVGETTDIVSKEMYSFKDRSDNPLTLRPEGTAGVVRAYIENGMHKDPQPVKLYYFGPMFRYDRPQSGRYREFYQAGVELLGELDPIVDAQIIAIVMKYYTKLGLKDIVVRINSVGDAKSRPKIQRALIDFLSAHRRNLCKDCKRRMTKNPLRVLDCKEKSCQAVAEEAGGVVLDNLNNDSRNYFTKVLEYLDDMRVEYELDPRLVRGLDYYTHTVFEVTTKTGGLSLGAGGRYDGLVELLGGPDTPAVGFAVGVERTIDTLKQQQANVPEPMKPNVFVVQLGDDAKKKAIQVIDRLDNAGYQVAHALGRGSIKSQLRVADRLGTSLAVIIGSQEVHDKSVIIRDLNDRTQESVLDRDMIKAVQRKLKEKK
ncbi:histidine--tRNA ligase [candidate division Kazan bacterium RIFCSPHIGHO2_01_FULL_44_14]|uniref:Histidine--tRNA ligase n=1 Tax=candidate division Kazan bacterium RIFCSPLOWO2_01_FULL_45_19 TaxID=1798538 RepID=A0A1F4NR07_UNCK3|nr:MAG: histidine--tRNA ligase [candidate division Kazan bacterium RIFCSPLOWO2_01_FULL_45_19]OGB78134.1 MAG: histidine--tRNA ligase [candidate division Kazan bacterium RIFCSPHIGHO2_01_FULL_44_14]